MTTYVCTTHNVQVVVNGNQRTIKMPPPFGPGAPPIYPAAQCALLTAMDVQAGVMRRVGPNGSPLAGECEVVEVG